VGERFARKKKRFAMNGPAEWCWANVSGITIECNPRCHPIEKPFYILGFMNEKTGVSLRDGKVDFDPSHGGGYTFPPFPELEWNKLIALRGTCASACFEADMEAGENCASTACD